MKRKDNKGHISNIGYMCKTDFDYDMHSAYGSVYSTLELLKSKQPCVKECGIVKVKIILEETVQEPDYFGKSVGSEVGE